MPTEFEKNQIRKSHRIQLPAHAYIDECKCSILDWSLEGFKCEVPESGLSDDWEGQVTFVLPLAGMNVTFDALARVRRIDDQEAGFSFEALNDKSKMLLKAYIQANIEGKIDDVQGIIAKVDAAEIPIETERPLTVAEQTAYKRTFRSRAILYWLLGLFAVGLVMFILYNNLSRAVSTRAVVSGALIDMAPEVGGFLEKISVVDGENVKKGQLLFAIDDDAMRRDLEQIKLRINVEKQELELLYTLLQEEERALGLYRSAADHEVEMVQQKIAGTRAKIELAEKEFKRAEALVKSGAVSRSFWDLRRKEYLEEKAELAELQEELELAQRNARSAKDGKYLSDGAARGQLREIRGRIQVQQKTLELRQYEMLKALSRLQMTRVTSPRDGMVYSIKRVDGTFLRPGESVLTLMVTDTRPWVLARFTFEEAKRLAPGNEAEVYVPSSGHFLTGVIQAIGHHAMAAGGVVSQDLETSMSEVPVKVLLDRDDPSLVPGLGVEVRVRTPVLGKLPQLSGALDAESR
mgnify:CR=1 FL=1